MTLTEFLLAVRRSAVLVAASVLVGIALAAALGLTRSIDYSATSRLFVATGQASDQSDLSFAQQIVASYADVVTTPYILEPVGRRLSPPVEADVLAGQVSASVETNRLLISITATTASAARSAEIANATADELIARVGALTPTASGGGAPVSITLVQKAAPPTASSAPGVGPLLLLGGVLGLLAGLGAAVVRARVDTRVREAQLIDEAFGAPFLGSLIGESSGAPVTVTTLSQPLGPASEQYRALRTNLQFVLADDGGHMFVVCSSIAEEGRTAAVMNLAVVSAQAGLRVLLVDGDLRRPRLSHYVGLDNTAGLTDVLEERVLLADAVGPWGTDNLAVLSAGTHSSNPSELLQSRAMSELLAALGRSYDVVLFDSPPLGVATDAAVLSKQMTGALLVVEVGKTHAAQVEAAVRTLRRAQASLLGVVSVAANSQRTRLAQYGSDR